MRSGLICTAAALLALTGCGGGDDDKSPAATTSGETTTAAEAGRFQAADVAFTFSFPDGFQQVNEDDGKRRAVVTPEPGDEKNGLKISLTSEQALPYESYIDTFQKQFQDDLGVKVTKRVEKHGDFPMGVLEWTKPYTYKDLGEEKTTRLKSTSYFFMSGGKAWHIECLSDAEHRDVIDEACAQALDSIEPT